jgi:hypothetical protein
MFGELMEHLVACNSYFKKPHFFYERSPAYKEYTVCVYARLPRAVGEYSYAVDYVAAMYS